MPLLIGAVLLLAGLLAPRAASAQSPFITTWETTSSNESITIPTEGGTNVTAYDFQIDWGDGTTEQYAGDDPDPSHQYSSAGSYQVEISGTFPRIYLNDPLNESPNSNKIESIDQWGDIAWESMAFAFAGAERLTYSATDAPDLSAVTDMSSMFEDAGSFNGDISSWDVSSVEDMSRMFRRASSFDQPVDAWNVSRVTTMRAMFEEASSFNQPIGSWNVSNVTDMGSMFGFASNFNQDISEWEVAGVTDMSNMFSGAESFDQPIGSWEVSGVTTMRSMFTGAFNFNQPIGNWDVSSVENMRNMFSGADRFNQPIGQWDVSGVSNMAGMFTRASSFNQPIGSWDVSSVTDMGGMFDGASSFNQDISGWDVSSVTEMEFMFYLAGSFDQDLSEWDVSSVIDMTNMFQRGGLSQETYDRILIGWSRLDLISGVRLDADTNYCDGEPFRAYLRKEYGWSIGDQGQASGCPSDLAASGTASVSSSGSVSFTNGVRVVFDLSSSSGSGEVVLGRFSDAPRNASSVSEANVSSYRVVLVASPELSLNSTTEVRFKASEFPGIDAPSDVTVYSRTTPGTGDFSAVTNTSYDSGNDEIVAQTGSFSELVFASNSNPLPVELTRFEARRGGDDSGDAPTVQLSWQTASETQNAGFRVERQAGGGDAEATWQQVGYVESKAAGGTSSEALSYRYRDGSVPFAADTVRYRLTQVDTDGQTSRSDVVEVALGAVDRLQLKKPYPNPARGAVTVKLAVPEAQGGSVQLRLYNALGQEVRAVPVAERGRQRIEVETDGLASGVYFLRLTAGEQTVTQRVTIVR